MKRIAFTFLLLIVGAMLHSQTTLLPINRDLFKSEFLLSISKHPFDYDNTGATPVYSFLTPKWPHIKWDFYGGIKLYKNYKLCVADGYPLWDCDGVQFATVAYTKGNFALVICSVISYADIEEHRLYTYDFNGNVIDSLVIHHQFVAESGHYIMPLSGALMGNLDVRVCEIRWEGLLPPYHLEKLTLSGGQHEGQRVDSYYSLDGTGHFVLKKQIKCYPRIYTEDEVSSMDFGSDEEPQLKVVFKSLLSVDEIQEVIEY